MHSKMFEVRDRGTLLPVLATLMRSDRNLLTGGGSVEQERWLLARGGMTSEENLAKRGAVLPLVVLYDFESNRATYNPHGWPVGRTLRIAHQYIEQNWATLSSGQVIDVQYIVAETRVEKKSARPSGLFIDFSKGTAEVKKESVQPTEFALTQTCPVCLADPGEPCSCNKANSGYQDEDLGASQEAAVEFFKGRD